MTVRVCDQEDSCDIGGVSVHIVDVAIIGQFDWPLAARAEVGFLAEADEVPRPIYRCNGACKRKCTFEAKSSE